MNNVHAPASFERSKSTRSDRHTSTGGIRCPCAPLLVVIACVFALCGAFLWADLTSPSDGTRVDPGNTGWQRQGVVVVPLVPQRGGLQTGDLIVAVDGHSLESWTGALFRPGATIPHFSKGQRITYSVVRGKQHLEVPVWLSAYPLGATLSTNWGMLVFIVVFELLGLFVYLRRPREAAAAVLFFGASCLLGSSAWLFGVQVISLTGGATFWLYSVSVLAVYLLFWSSLLHFSLVFPRPSGLVHTHPWLVPLLYILPCGAYAGYLIVTWTVAAPSTLAWLGLWEPGEVGIGIAYVALAVLILSVTYRTQRDLATRLQIRWVVFASVISGGGAIVLWIIPNDVLGHPIISINLLGLLLLPFPTALAIAILRYQLFDIDVIIRRTLIYSLISGTLAVIYAVTSLLLEAAFYTLTGQGSALTIVGSTLAIIALFQPVRSRVQTVVDRRFYRRKYDAARTLEAFAATLQAELDLAQLSQRLVAIVEETMHPTSVSLWLSTRETPTGLQDSRTWKQAAHGGEPDHQGVQAGV
jgi:two-component system, NarL family, sensor kinase